MHRPPVMLICAKICAKCVTRYSPKVLTKGICQSTCASICAEVCGNLSNETWSWPRSHTFYAVWICARMCARSSFIETHVMHQKFGGFVERSLEALWPRNHTFDTMWICARICTRYLCCHTSVIPREAIGPMKAPFYSIASCFGVPPTEGV